MLLLPPTPGEYSSTRRKNRSMSMINKKDDFENDQMLRKLPSQSSELDEEQKNYYLLPNISHCDFYSVCFSLEENAELFKEKTAISVSKENSKRRVSRTCDCECYLPKGSRSREDHVAPCDSYFILETSECICRPPTSAYLTQGYPPNYVNIEKTSTATSSSYYLNIYEHIVGPKIKSGCLYRTSVIPTILNWDISMSESRLFRFEHIDYGALFYREYFLSKDHDNFIGTDPIYGPFAISIKREILEQKINSGGLILDGNTFCDDSHFVIKPKFSHEPNSSIFYPKNEISQEESSYNVVFRIIARFISTYTLRVILPDIKKFSDSKSRHKLTSSRRILTSLFPKLSPTCTYMVSNKSIQQDLLEFDEDLALACVHKIGIMYCGIDQTTESQMYGNISGSAEYDKFLGLLGSTVVLKGFEGYAAMLDTVSDLSGINSVYTEFHNRKIMFHVATMLPHDPTNPQQVCKKRYIGNDVVTVIFQDEKASPFSPNSFLSQFQHVFIVVRVCIKGHKTYYKVAVFRVHDVPYFGPPISEDLIPHGDYFRQFILTKIINAEYACQKSSIFLKLATRTRYHCLMDLKKYQSSAHTEKTQLFPFKFRASTTDRLAKTALIAPSYLSSHCALIWACLLDVTPLNKSVNCAICVSAYCVSIVDLSRKETILTVINKYLIAWRLMNQCTLRIFHRAGNSFTFKLVDKDVDKMMQLFIARIGLVSNIVEATTILFTPPINPADLIVDEYAVIKKVSQQDPGRICLSVGDQILEIENILLNTLTSKKFYDILFEGSSKRLLVARCRNQLNSNRSSISSHSRRQLFDADNKNQSLIKEKNIKVDHILYKSDLITIPSDIVPFMERYATPPFPVRGASREYLSTDFHSVLSTTSKNKMVPIHKSDTFIRAPQRSSSFCANISNITRV